MERYQLIGITTKGAKQLIGRYGSMLQAQAIAYDRLKNEYGIYNNKEIRFYNRNVYLYCYRVNRHGDIEKVIPL